jgi:hypothetical protein
MALLILPPDVTPISGPVPMRAGGGDQRWTSAAESISH